MNSFVSSEACTRPKGAPEFFAFSLKKGQRVRFFHRASLWRWACLEFNHRALSLKVNEQVLTTPNGKLVISISYEDNVSDNLVILDGGICTALREDVIRYGEMAGCVVEFINRSYLLGRETAAENFLRMISYIVKRRDVLTERNLEQSLRMVQNCNSVVQEAVNELAKVFGESSAALFFELVRRGTVNLAEIQECKLTGRTKFSVGELARG